MNNVIKFPIVNGYADNVICLGCRQFDSECVCVDEPIDDIMTQGSFCVVCQNEWIDCYCFEERNW